MKVALIWSDELKKYDFGFGHPLRSKRCVLGINEIGKIENIDIIPPRKATEEELELFHTH